MNIFQRNAKKLVIVPMLSGAASVVFIRLIEAGSLAIGFYRLGLAALLFGIPILFGGYKNYKETTKKDVAICILAGFVLFLHFVCWFTAINSTSIASATVLFSLHPLVILVVTCVGFRKKVKVKAIMGILVALSGGALIASVNQTLDGNFIFGDIMGFAAGIFFGGYFLLGQIMRAKMPTVNYVFIVFSSCFVFFAIAMFVTQTPYIGYRPEDYILIVAMTIVCQVLAHAMYNWCMGYTSSLYVSTFTSVQSVVAVIYGIVFFSEFPVFLQWIGVAIAVSGLIYYNFNSQEISKEEKLKG